MPNRSRALLVASVLVIAVAIGVVSTCFRASGAKTSPIVANAPAKSLKAERPVSSLFDPALASALLDDSKRDSWQMPARIVAELHLGKGEAVADIGAGSGYLMRYLSRAVGPQGCVFAEEIQPDYLPALHRRAKQAGNVRVVLGNVIDPNLPARSVDCFVLLTVYHEVEHPVEFLSTLRRSARTNARLAIIDFDAGRHGTPPAPDGHEIAEATVIAEAKRAGWEVAERHDFLSSQFYLVFRHARK
jgi:SAM-dependent methyltransferase